MKQTGRKYTLELRQGEKQIKIDFTAPFEEDHRTAVNTARDKVRILYKERPGKGDVTGKLFLGEDLIVSVKQPLSNEEFMQMLYADLEAGRTFPTPAERARIDEEHFRSLKELSDSITDHGVVYPEEELTYP